jgi:hypothetical protein
MLCLPGAQIMVRKARQIDKSSNNKCCGNAGAGKVVKQAIRLDIEKLRV